MSWFADVAGRGIYFFFFVFFFFQAEDGIRDAQGSRGLGDVYRDSTNRDHLDEILSHSGKDYRMFNVEKGEFAEI